jgi:hypothetical protein
MPLKLSHHVYSSLGGYRPVFVSPDMPKEFVGPLEALAKGVYLTAQRTDLYMWLQPRESNDIIVSKGFRNGTDRAGRSRSCVHSIVLSANDAAGSWFFSPLSLPEGLFANADSQLQALGNQLAPQCETPSPSNPRPSENLPRSVLASMLALMIHPTAKGLILDSRGDAVATLRALTWLVPPPARRNITLAAWAVAPDVDPFGPARITVLAPKSESLKTMPKPDVVIEYPSGKVNEESEDDEDEITFNVYAEFVASNLSSERGFERMRKLAGLLERHPPGSELTQERYRHILEGFARIEPLVEEWGAVKIRNDVKASLGAVTEFALAGMPSLSLDILDTVVSLAVDQYDMNAESIKRTLTKLRTKMDPGDHRFVDACGFLADQLRDVADALGRGNGG